MCARRRQRAQVVAAIDDECAIDRLKAMPPAVVKKLQADDAGLLQNYCQEALVGVLARDVREIEKMRLQMRRRYSG